MLFCIGGVAAMVAIATLGPVLALAVSGFIAYVAWKQYQKTSKSVKLFWGLAGMTALLTAIINMPAILGVGAVAVLYVVYKKWKEQDVAVMDKDNDPFVNFEKQWNNLTKMNR
jgi:lia operon protein LiaI